MARIRTIKPGFFKNEQLADLTPQVRLLFIGLWTIADKEGKLEDRPKRIKAELFPYDSFDIEPLLERLHVANFIKRYEAAGMKVIQVINFSKHQRITGSEATSESELPDSPNGNTLETLGSTEETPRTTGKDIGKGYRERSDGKEYVPPDEKIIFTIEHCLVVALNDSRWVKANKTNEAELKAFNEHLEKQGKFRENPMEYKRYFANWKPKNLNDDLKPAQTLNPIHELRRRNGLDKSQ